MLSTEDLLRKAILTDSDGSAGAFAGSGGDFGTSGAAPISIEQAVAFIELMAAQQVMLSDVRTVTSSKAKWQESILSFSSRVARAGNEAQRLLEADRAKPDTGIVEITTALLRAEVPISDEVMEDNVAGTSVVGAVERTLSDRFGFDIEDLMLNATVGNIDPYYALLPNGGWLYQAENGRNSNAGGTGNAVDGSSYGQDYQSVFRVMLNSMPYRFLRNLETDGRFYIPKRVEQKYRDFLASRGTALGDLMLTGKNELRYQGILIVGVPSMLIANDDTSKFLLSNHNNLYAGYHRAMKFETWRDPREGATSFIITARVDAEVAVPEATVLAHDVDCSV